MFSPIVDTFLIGSFVGGFLGFLSGTMLCTYGYMAIMANASQKHNAEIEKLRAEITERISRCYCQPDSNINN